MRYIGVCELLGTVGLVVPDLTHIQPWLSIAAALGLAVVLIGALIVHMRSQEFSRLLIPSVMLLLTLFVALGRGFLLPL